jgi:hypothetical protein
MGGWCSRRDQCPHHHAQDRRQPVERLCLPGRDGQRLIDSTQFRSVTVDVFSGLEVARDREAA